MQVASSCSQFADKLNCSCIFFFLFCLFVINEFILMTKKVAFLVGFLCLRQYAAKKLPNLSSSYLDNVKSELKTFRGNKSRTGKTRIPRMINCTLKSYFLCKPSQWLLLDVRIKYYAPLQREHTREL